MTDTTDSRMDALQTALQSVVDAAATHRPVSRDFVPIDQRSADDLRLGVWSLVVVDEDEFAHLTGGQSDTGRLNVVAVGHIQVRDDDPGSALESAELSMVSEIKTLVNSALPAAICGLRLIRWRISGQLSRPYGWVTANLQII